VTHGEYDFYKDSNEWNVIDIGREKLEAICMSC